jgi:hypothetical protein
MALTCISLHTDHTHTHTRARTHTEPVRELCVHFCDPLSLWSFASSPKLFFKLFSFFV